MWEVLIKRHGIQKTVDELITKQKAYKTKRFLDEKLEPIDGIIDLLRDGKRNGLKIALATSSPKYFAKFVLRSVKTMVFFNELVTADDVCESKPNPEIYLKAAKVLRVLPEECIAIEDAHFGVLSAKGAGMRCIGYKNPNSGNQDISMADLVVSSIEDINLAKIMKMWG